MAFVAFVSCNTSDIIDQTQSESITFGSVFVENVTKATDPSYGADNAISSFDVYGTVEADDQLVNIYNGAEVSNSNGEWLCSETNYWINGALYSFVALVDVPNPAISGGLPVSFEYLLDSQKDVLYANASATGKSSGNEPVAFIFQHLLAKAVFNFTNIDPNANLTVSDISISGLHRNGVYSNGSWSSDTATSLSFGGSSVNTGATSSSQFERMIIPGTYDLTISFNINDDKGGQEQEISTTIENLVFESGKAYNFTAQINSGLKFIEFTINPVDWVESNGNIQG